MENTIINVSPQVPAREIGIVTAEIKELCLQANRMALMYAIEIGRRLIEAKSILKHGEWGNWLENEVEFSQSTANNFMKLFEEYGAEQISIFGAVTKSQSFANLPYTKALQLLAVPSEERERFAEKVKADDISVKELQTAIKERNAAVKEAEEARKREVEYAQACSEAESARDAAEEKAAEAEQLKSELEKLKKAIENPEIPPEKLKQIKAEAEADLQEKFERAEAERVLALARAKEAEDKLANVQDKPKIINPEIAAFKALFDSMQETAVKLKNKIDSICVTDPEMASKLSAALKAFGNTL